MISVRVLRPIAIVASLALVGFITFAVVTATRHTSGAFPLVPAASQLESGEQAPTFDIARLGGGARVAFDGRSTEPVVLNFFASWCAGCVAELNAFAAVAKQSSSIHFVGIDSDDSSPSAAVRLLHRSGVPYPVGVDPDGVIANRYLVSALPVTLFIAADGTVRGELFGAATASQLRGWVIRLTRAEP